MKIRMKLRKLRMKFDMFVTERYLRKHPGCEVEWHDDDCLCGVGRTDVVRYMRPDL